MKAPSVFLGIIMFAYRGVFGKSEISYRFRYPETSLYFHQFLKKADPSDDDIVIADSDFLWAEEKWKMIKNSYLEYCLCLYRTSDYLSQNNSCLFHGAAFQLNRKAYIVSADSGVGKTTQIINLMSLYSDQIQVMNGDKPILCMESDKQLTVYPSPWKGKEEWGDDSIISPLGGIILLKQGKENQIKRINSLHYGARLLSYFFSSFEKEMTVRKLCEIETAMWRTVPIWELTNTGDIESAKMIYQTILENENEIYIKR